MKKAIKWMITAVFYILVLPFGLSTIIFKKLFGSPVLFHLFAESFSLFPIHIGQFIRACFYNQTLKQCPIDVVVMFGSHLTKMDSIIGRNVVIAGHTTIGLVNAGDNAAIGSHCSLLSGRQHHGFEKVKDHVLDGEETFSMLRIGESTFIGDCCTIMADIGDYSVIGAGSVVVKDIPELVIAVGNPARVIKERSRPENYKADNR